MKKIIYFLIIIILFGYLYLSFTNRFYLLQKNPEYIESSIDMSYQDFLSFCKKENGEIKEVWGRGANISVNIQCNTKNKVYGLHPLTIVRENVVEKVMND